MSHLVNKSTHKIVINAQPIRNGKIQFNEIAHQLNMRINLCRYATWIYNWNHHNVRERCSLFVICAHVFPYMHNLSTDILIYGFHANWVKCFYTEVCAAKAKWSIDCGFLLDFISISKCVIPPLHSGIEILCILSTKLSEMTTIRNFTELRTWQNSPPNFSKSTEIKR